MFSTLNMMVFFLFCSGCPAEGSGQECVNPFKAFQGCMRLLIVDNQEVDLMKVQERLIGNYSHLQVDMCGIIDRWAPFVLVMFCKCCSQGLYEVELLFTEPQCVFTHSVFVLHCCGAQTHTHTPFRVIVQQRPEWNEQPVKTFFLSLAKLWPCSLRFYLLGPDCHCVSVCGFAKNLGYYVSKLLLVDWENCHEWIRLLIFLVCCSSWCPRFHCCCVAIVSISSSV